MATLTATNDVMSDMNDIIIDKTDKLMELFDRLVSETEGLEDYDMPIKKKNELITNVEYILSRLRFLVTDELCRIDYVMASMEKNALAQEKTQEQIRKKFSNRKNFLCNMNNRLNDIREDLSLIEKTYYYNNIKD